MLMIGNASLISQLHNLIDRKRFRELILKHQSARYAKRFNIWDHFAATLFCQLAQVTSLGEACDGLAGAGVIGF